MSSDSIFNKTYHCKLCPLRSSLVCNYIQTIPVYLHNLRLTSSHWNLQYCIHPDLKEIIFVKAIKQII